MMMTNQYTGQVDLQKISLSYPQQVAQVSDLFCTQKSVTKQQLLNFQVPTNVTQPLTELYSKRILL
jgi:hypothetical protein